MKLLTTIILLLSLGSVLPVFAAETPDFVPPYTPSDELRTDPVVLPPVAKETFPNGMTVYLVEQHKLPKIAFQLFIPQGTLNDPEGKAGLTDFTASLVRKGFKLNGRELGANAISQMLDSVGVRCDADASTDGVAINISGLSKYTPFMLDILSATLLQPTFPEREINRTKSQVLASFIARRDEPGGQVGDIFRKELYGNTPQGLSQNGDSATVSTFTREDLIAQWSRIAIADGAKLGVTGDFDSKFVLELIKSRFNSWNRGTKLPNVPDVDPVVKGIQVRIFDKPDAAQSVIRMGHRGIDRKDKDFYIQEVMSHILMGHGFDSRLMKEIRTVKGMTYGIYGSFSVGKRPGLMSIGTSTRTERTGEMISTIMRILRDFREAGPSEDEVLQAKMYLTGSYPLDFETASAICGTVVLNDWMELPPNTVADYRKNIAAVTKADIQRVAKRLLDPENILICIGGNKTEVLKQLQATGLKFEYKESK